MIDLLIIWALFSFQMSGERDRCIKNNVPTEKCAVDVKTDAPVRIFE